MHRVFSVGDVVCHQRHHEHFGRGLVKEVDSLGRPVAAHFSRLGVTVRADGKPLVHASECGECIRAEEERSRLERQAREAAEAEAQAREAAIQELKASLADDYLGARDRVYERYKGRLAHQEIETLIADHVRGWFARRATAGPATVQTLPDPEQLAAISVGATDTLLVARAGSGKTATIIHRARFLHEHCGVPTDSILMLAFNRAAADEMKTRLEAGSSSTWNHVMTFHALAWSIVQPNEEVIFDESDERPRLKRFVQAVIDDALRSSSLAPEIKRLMLMRWRSDWERFNEGGYGLTGAPLVEYRRSLVRETIRGEYVKSYGEKVIANFLFQHGLRYAYEKPITWGERAYRPDFIHYLPGGRGVVIEYFGLAGDPDYDQESEQKKLFWSQQEGWSLIELYPDDVLQPDFESRLRQRLKELGVTCYRMSDEELWVKVQARAHSKFAASVTAFIMRARKIGLGPDGLAEMVRTHQAATEVEALFLTVASGLFRDYLARLKATGEEDFDGLLARAGELVRCGRTSFARKSGAGDLASMRFVFVDEFQDFAPLYFGLLDAIRTRNPAVRFFCVGDDWQSINGFAGASLKYFNEFEDWFPGATRMYLSTNYRSAPEIVEVANRLMRDTGGVESRPSRNVKGSVLVADIDQCLRNDRELTLSEEGQLALAPLRVVADCFQDHPWLLRPVGDGGGPVDVAFLCRTGNPMYARSSEPSGESGIERLKRLLRNFVPHEDRRRLDVSTTHGYKGKQRRVVVVADAFARRYPLVHPEWLFMQVFGDSLATVLDEERRLFYVALTRARDVLVILTDGRNPSPFIKDLGVTGHLDWSRLPAVREVDAAARRTLVVIDDRGGSGGTFSIKDHLKADSFRFDGVFKLWRLGVSPDFKLAQYLERCSWRSIANNVVAAVVDENNEASEAFAIQNGEARPRSGWSLVRR